MGRRKKESPDFHRESIASAAESLFISKGISAATMSELAQTAGYSKATLYVYFQSKEEIIEYLALKGMTQLLSYIRGALSGAEGRSVKERYQSLCGNLVSFQREFPFHFELILEELQIDYERPGAPSVEKELFDTGEQVNAEIAGLLQDGMACGSLRQDLRILPTVFLFWAGISGIIRMADRKGEYIEKVMGMPVQEFLDYGFETLYRSIETGGVH